MKLGYLLIIIVVMMGVAVASASLQTSHNPSQPPHTNPISVPTQQAPLPTASDSSRNLMLKSFVPTSSPEPTATDSCFHDQGKKIGSNCTCQAYTVTCQNEKCVDVKRDVDHTVPITCEEINQQRWCAVSSNLAKEGDGQYCLGKPVIYLYPEKPTYVDVVLSLPGVVTVSDPLYPAGGWKQVLANPDGSLFYQGKGYHELYYESSVHASLTPIGGVYIPRKYLEQTLRDYVRQLGLLQNEENEFIQYWLPKLEALHKEYIYFSILTPEQKNQVDHVSIQPAPDTFIEFIAYFKGVDTMMPSRPLRILSVAKRQGFTAVEWGGFIDQK